MIKREPKTKLINQAKHRIVFQQKTKTSDGEGGFTVLWTDFLYRWAAVLPIRALQRFTFESVNVEATHYIKTRGYLSLPDRSAIVGTVLVITWTGIVGETVKIEYSVNGGEYVLIGASESNTGAYSWTVPVLAIGESVVIKISSNDDETEFTTDPYLIVSSLITDREVAESDRILFGSRIFEILSIEDIQECNFEKFITCKERRD